MLVFSFLHESFCLFYCNCLQASCTTHSRASKYAKHHLKKTADNHYISIELCLIKMDLCCIIEGLAYLHHNMIPKVAACRLYSIIARL